MWKEGSKVLFVVKVVERDVIAVSNAAVELAGGASSAAPKKSLAVAGTSLAVADFESSKIFVGLDSVLSTLDPSTKAAQIKKVGAVFAFDIKNGQGKVQSWFIDLKACFCLLYI